MSSVAERLELVRERIRGAAERAGRAADSVRLIAVSKTQPVEAILAAYAAGQRDFGENYVQELTAKAEALAHLEDLRWHMIGHLQRNKVRHVVRSVSAIHSADSVELVHELGKRLRGESSAEAPRTLSVLVEVNLAREPQKHGVDPDALEPVLAAVERERALVLSGLMCVPPVSDHAEASRPYFDALALLRDRHGGRARLPELSMGLTQDLEPAIAAGATFVRVGTAIFGDRPRKTG
jgi:pyridoxal phosphate enzyme (YggS family)